MKGWLPRFGEATLLLMAVEDAIQMLHIVRWLSAQQPRRTFWHPGPDLTLGLLYSIMSHCRIRNATDPRGKVYALLGLVTHDVDVFVKPNYHDSVQDAYVQVTERSIGLSGILEQIEGADNFIQDLPSWIADWSTSKLASRASFVRSRHETFCSPPTGTKLYVPQLFCRRDTPGESTRNRRGGELSQPSIASINYPSVYRASLKTTVWPPQWAAMLGEGDSQGQGLPYTYSVTMGEAFWRTVLNHLSLTWHITCSLGIPPKRATAEDGKVSSPVSRAPIT